VVEVWDRIECVVSVTTAVIPVSVVRTAVPKVFAACIAHVDESLSGA
jgi:hypothetical protein